MDAARSIINKAKKDFPGWCERFVRIKNKDGLVVPFVLNKPQLVIWQTLKQLLDAGKPIRVVILKARQYGISTFTQAFLLWLTVTRQGQNCLIIGQNLDMTGELFGKIETMYDLMPDWFKPKRDSKTRGKRLAFAKPNHGLLYVDTAENRDAGRSGTFQHVHCTEIPFWPDAKRTMDGLLQSVPKRKGTSVIVESTAHGVGDYFHDLWIGANDPDNPNGFTPIFIPWYIHEEYVETPIEGEIFPEWIVELGRKYDLSREQQCFYYYKYLEFNCDMDTLMQEYPTRAEDAFKASGRPFFNTKSLQYQKEHYIQPPKRKGMWVPRNNKPVWVEGEGSFHIWEEPIRGEKYVLGVDISTGRSKDFSVIQVLKGLEQVAAYRGKIDPDELAYLASWCGKVYNTGLIIPERNGIGLATVLKLVNDIKYPRLYTHERVDTTNRSVSVEYGYTTTGRNRIQILDDINSLIRTGELKIRDVRTLNEMEAFVFSGTGTKDKPEAASGKNDDTVMALALAVHAAEYSTTGPLIVEYSETI